VFVIMLSEACYEAWCGISLSSPTSAVMLRLNTVELPARFFEKADLAIKIASSAHQ
jgi:hypothetical protein